MFGVFVERVDTHCTEPLGPERFGIERNKKRIWKETLVESEDFSVTKPECNMATILGFCSSNSARSPSLFFFHVFLHHALEMQF